jgi:hypothetical protein
MDNRNKEVTATFSTHYGAMLTKKKLGDRCTLRPVPRLLSSSCGTCAVVKDSTVEELKNAAGEYLEGIFLLSEGRYEKIL